MVVRRTHRGRGEREFRAFGHPLPFGHLCPGLGRVGQGPRPPPGQTCALGVESARDGRRDASCLARDVASMAIARAARPATPERGEGCLRERCALPGRRPPLRGPLAAWARRKRGPRRFREPAGRRRRRRSFPGGNRATGCDATRGSPVGSEIAPAVPFRVWGSRGVGCGCGGGGDGKLGVRPRARRHSDACFSARSGPPFSRRPPSSPLPPSTRSPRPVEAPAPDGGGGASGRMACGLVLQARGEESPTQMREGEETREGARRRGGALARSGLGRRRIETRRGRSRRECPRIAARRVCATARAR